MEDFIKIQQNEFKLPKLKDKILIFTSKNAVISVFNQYPDLKLKTNIILCVGKKTEQLLKNQKLQVKHTANSAKELGEWLCKNNKNKHSVLHFCGNLNRKELQYTLTNNQINYSEIEVYKTTLTPKKIKNSFDGILFLSPSAVTSYVLANESFNTVSFCIGKTTANEAKKHFKQVVISEKLSIENSLKIIEKYYGNIQNKKIKS